MNIVQLILSMLTKGDTLSKLAPILGISQDQTTKGVNAAVPSLLAGITSKASEPGGASTLANTLHHEEHGFLENFPGFGSSTYGSNTSGISSRGNEALNSILGGSTLNQISNAVARFTGISDGIVSKLLGMIAPVVLGVIGKQTKGMDAPAIGNFLSGQKENIASAMPSGLATMLGSAVPSIGKFMGTTTTTSTEHHEEPSFASSTRHEDRTHDRTPVGAGTGHERSHNAWKWILPLVIAGLVLYFLPRALMVRNHERPAAVGERQDREMHQGYSAETSKIANEGNSLIQSATDTVSGITDEASAATATPKLRNISSKLESLRTVMERLPEPAQKAVADTLRGPAGNLQSVAKPVMSMPTVGPQVKPAMDELFGELNQIIGEEKAIPALPPQP